MKAYNCLNLRNKTIFRSSDHGHLRIISKPAYSFGKNTLLDTIGLYTMPHATMYLSSILHFIIHAAPPMRPLVDVSESRFSSISLEWEKPWSHYPIRNFTLALLNAAGDQLRTTTVPNRKGSMTYRVSGLEGGTRYRFRLRANSNAGKGACME